MTNKFDPNEHDEKDGGKGGGGGGRLTTAGMYILVAGRKPERGRSNSKKPFMLMRFTVIGDLEGDGSQVKKTFLERFYLTKEAQFRLARFCRAVGHMEAFDLDSDREFREALCGKPFKARVKVRTTDDNKKYPEIGYFVYADNLDEADIAVMDEWEAEREASGGYGQSDDPGPTDDDYDGGGSRGRGGPDDDIPF